MQRRLFEKSSSSPPDPLPDTPLFGRQPEDVRVFWLERAFVRLNGSFGAGVLEERRHGDSCVAMMWAGHGCVRSGVRSAWGRIGSPAPAGHELTCSQRRQQVGNAGQGFDKERPPGRAVLQTATVKLENVLLATQIRPWWPGSSRQATQLSGKLPARWVRGFCLVPWGLSHGT